MHKVNIGAAAHEVPLVNCYPGFYLSSAVNVHLCSNVAIMSSCASVTCSSMSVLNVLR